VSRTEIVEHTGLSPATVSTITSTLINDGLLLSRSELGQSQDSVNRRGRPRVTLSLNPQLGCIVVMVLSINKLTAWLQDYAGQILAQASDQFDSRNASLDDFEHYLLRMVTRLMSQQSNNPMPLRFISLGVQGVVDSGGQTMLWSPMTTLLDVPLGDMLNKAFNVPVWVANDCNMAAEALHWKDPQRFGDDFAAILLGSGIGMGLVLKGRRFIGRHSSAAEFGHMVHAPSGGALCRCGQHGCVEAYVGDYAIWRRVSGASELSEPVSEIDPQAMLDLARRAHEQDGIERAAYCEAGRVLGNALRSLFALIDPITIAFIGGGVRSFDLMEPEIRNALRHNGNMLESSEVDLYCYEDSQDLIHLGCAITTLQRLDRNLGIGG
jgi:predicted NBD/HSP70 family sugar kinase